MKKELEKNYNPKDIEDRLYTKWVNKKYFHAEVNPDKKPYTTSVGSSTLLLRSHLLRRVSGAIVVSLSEVSSSFVKLRILKLRRAHSSPAPQAHR